MLQNFEMLLIPFVFGMTRLTAFFHCCRGLPSLIAKFMTDNCVLNSMVCISCRTVFNTVVSPSPSMTGLRRDL